MWRAHAGARPGLLEVWVAGRGRCAVCRLSTVSRDCFLFIALCLWPQHAVTPLPMICMNGCKHVPSTILFKDVVTNKISLHSRTLTHYSDYHISDAASRAPPAPPRSLAHASSLAWAT